jgi:capsular polysaccharide biosynthesis protein
MHPRLQLRVIRGERKPPEREFEDGCYARLLRALYGAPEPPQAPKQAPCPSSTPEPGSAA